MLFSLINMPSTFQQMMDHILKEASFAPGYLNDVISFSWSLWHLTYLSAVLDLLCKYQLKLRVGNCAFCLDHIELLSHIVSHHCGLTDPRKTKSIRNSAVPTNYPTVQGSLVLSGYYRCFIRNFADMSAPLHTLTLPMTRFKMG